MDPLLLSQTQFGALSAFHLLFPILTMTLGWVLLAFRMHAMRTKNLDSRWAFGFWMPVYAMTAAFQVVSAGALVSQFGLTWPGVMEQASGVIGPLCSLWALGLAMQVLCLGIAARGFGDLPERAVGLFIALSALGAFIAVAAPVLIVTWLSDPVGEWSDPSTLTAVDWGGLFTAPMFWKTLLWAVALSGVTTGGLMVSLSVLKAMFGGRPFAQEPAFAFGARVALASVPVALIWCGLDGMQNHVLMGASLGVLFAVLLAGMTWGERASLVLSLALIAVPLVGWIAALASWSHSDLILGQWAIQGHLRFDQAAAVSPVGEVSRTLPLYLVTICCLVVSFFVVLVLMTHKAAAPGKTAENRKKPLFHPSR